MKKISKAFIAICLVLITVIVYPSQVFASSQKYVSEVKIGMGKTVKEAAESLSGYTIVKYGKDYADLNEDAAPVIKSGYEEEKVVLLGYKTTYFKEEAITDLALMNMDGDYFDHDYGMMIDQMLQGEIVPFIRDFIAAIKEYRENYNSDIPENRTRAQFFHDGLNSLIDDDTGMKLGDLLLNETKFEMGEKAYNKLSKQEKKKHADILTLLLQCNCKALVIIKTMVAWATDSNEDTWLDRLSNLTYDDLLTQAEDEFGYGPYDAKRYLAREYEDDAKKVLALWKDFQPQLANYEQTSAYLDEQTDIEEEFKDYRDKLEGFDIKTASESEVDEFAEASVQAQLKAETFSNAVADVTAAEHLEEIAYGDGTMLDFFSQEYVDIKDDLTVLFPVVAALSDGQRASLDFVSLSELVRMTIMSGGDYSEFNFDDMAETSVYLGVDRSVYGLNGLAATPNALKNSESPLQMNPLAGEAWDALYQSMNTIMSGVTNYIMPLVRFGTNVWKVISMALFIKKYSFVGSLEYSQISTISTLSLNAIKSHLIIQVDLAKEAGKEIIKTTVEESGLLDRIKGAASGFDKFMNVVSYALFIYTAYSCYSTYKEIMNYYNIDFAPAPRNIVDLVNIMAYTESGEQVYVKNQTVYYEAVKCNRTSSDKKYKALNDIADMKGDVGRQWVCLYASKSSAMAPILADSFLVLEGSDGGKLPAGYKKGIHLFETTAALDLNSVQYTWNHGKDGIYVYYKTDDSAATTGSVFSNGYIAIAAVCGIALGAVATAVAMTSKKKKENQTQTVN